MTAARLAMVAVTVYAATRTIQPARRDQRAEDAFDDLHEGPALRRDGDGARGAMRFRRTVRVGHAGPGIEIDFAGLARLRLRRV
jgi:hypothetical protein